MNANGDASNFYELFGSLRTTDNIASLLKYRSISRRNGLWAQQVITDLLKRCEVTMTAMNNMALL